ncbi:ABC transporter substrate-binding protein [Dictyobacter formicarum]|uniref:Arabinose-binding protein n=1 Tax=Dictyobacter formicarum TaxID=2778368 RepID=A0ABQ3VN40_9CHLR|nr:extracellular solute-binding protein [Dictyobacter formicarum]GHO87096.1 putative arabinose-binding protein [Dictyobacter formicarum]
MSVGSGNWTLKGYSVNDTVGDRIVNVVPLLMIALYEREEHTMKSISRRTFLSGTGGLIVSGGVSEILLSGCAPAVNTGAKKVLKAWVFSSGRYKWHVKSWKLYQQRKNPDFVIDWTLLPYQQMHDMVLITSQAGSGGPDIADIEISAFSRFIKGDVIFVDLTPRLQQAGVLDDFYGPSALAPWSWQGKVYGLGSQLNTCFLAYRWDLLEKAGVKTPFITWDDFAEQAKRYHQNTGQYLIDFPYNDWTSWWVMALQQDSGFFGPDSKLTFTSAQGLNTLQYQKQAIDSWSVLRPLGQSYNTALSTGAIACVMGPPWNFGSQVEQVAANTSGKWHVQPLPRWTPHSSPTATWGGTGTTTLKTSHYPDEAIDFILFEHTTPDALYFDFAARQIWPAYKPALLDPRLNEPLAFFDHQRVGNLIRTLSPEINKWYTSPFWSETTDAFVRKAVTPCLLQGNAPEAALLAAQHEVNRIVSLETA